MMVGRTIAEVFAENKENEITGSHIYAKPKQVIPYFYWSELCNQLGRLPTEDEQRMFYLPTENENASGN